MDESICKSVIVNISVDVETRYLTPIAGLADGLDRRRSARSYRTMLDISKVVSREWGLCVRVVLTFQNVERDGTTGEQGLCKGETKELRGLEEYNGEPRRTKKLNLMKAIDRSIRVYGESKDEGNSRFVCCAVRR